MRAHTKLMEKRSDLWLPEGEDRRRRKWRKVVKMHRVAILCKYGAEMDSLMATVTTAVGYRQKAVSGNFFLYFLLYP